jgi:DNA-binding protein HU-beta
MTKADLYRLSGDDFELSKRQTGEIIDALLDEIKAALRAGDKVQLIPFGSFMVRDRKRREGRNPKQANRSLSLRDACLRFPPGKPCAMRSAATRKSR